MKRQVYLFHREFDMGEKPRYDCSVNLHLHLQNHIPLAGSIRLLSWPEARDILDWSVPLVSTAGILADGIFEFGSLCIKGGEDIWIGMRCPHIVAMAFQADLVHFGPSLVNKVVQISEALPFGDPTILGRIEPFNAAVSWVNPVDRLRPGTASQRVKRPGRG